MSAGFIVLAAALTLASCGGSEAATAVAGSNRAVASLTLSESAVTLQVGLSDVLVATPRDSDGTSVPGVEVAWSSEDSAIAWVSDGRVTGVAVGSTRIDAVADGHRAFATLTVIPAVVAAVHLSRTSATLSPGRTLQLVAEPLDLLGRVITGRGVTFVSSDTTVAEVGQDGLVQAAGIGEAVVSATSDSQTTTMRLTVVAPTQVSIPLSASAPVGFPPLAGFAVVLRQPDDSVAFASAGALTGGLAGSMAMTDTVQLVARADTGFESSALAAPAAALPASVPVVFIPHHVTLTSGSFIGMTRAASMGGAVASCNLASDECAPGSGFYPVSFRTGVQAWASLPIAVSLTGVDSAAVWDALHALEAAVGHSLFVPDTGTSTGRIEVRAGLPPGVGGNAVGYAQWQWDASDRITGATVWLLSLNRRVIEHEFVHALGFGHTCSWPSVMGGYGCPQLEATADDVAYILLARAVHEAETPFRLASGALPCGAMGVWAAIPADPETIACNGDVWLDRTARVAAARGPQPPPDPLSRSRAMP